VGRGGEGGGRRSQRGDGGGPTRQRGIGAPRAHDIEGEFDVWEKAVPEVIREVVVSGSEGGDKVVLACPH
jgi:hypothetical protein